jgi:hypothetical protein
MGHGNSTRVNRELGSSVGETRHPNSTPIDTASQQAIPRSPVSPNESVLMQQYQILVDTYKTYLDLVLKFVLFSYAVTGGIVSYCLAQRQNAVIKFGLLFPIFMNLLFAGLCFLGASRVKPLADEVERVTDELKLLATPDIQFLTWVLSLLGILFLLICFGLGVALFIVK